jgi:hypothetical protein
MPYLCYREWGRDRAVTIPLHRPCIPPFFHGNKIITFAVWAMVLSPAVATVQGSLVPNFYLTLSLQLPYTDVFFGRAKKAEIDLSPCLFLKCRTRVP